VSERGKNDELQLALHRLSVPGALELGDAVGDGRNSPALAGKRAIDGRSTAYVCVGETCTAPITEAQEFTSRLKEARSEHAVSS
jgi:uncharacterized protein YyaL (SSP411 family)